MIVEELLSLRSMLHIAQQNGDLDSMEHSLVAGLFGGTQDFKP